MARCPLCGSPAFQLLTTFECEGPSCANHALPRVPTVASSSAAAQTVPSSMRRWRVPDVGWALSNMYGSDYIVWSPPELRARARDAHVLHGGGFFGRKNGGTHDDGAVGTEVGTARGVGGIVSIDAVVLEFDDGWIVGFARSVLEGVVGGSVAALS